MKVESALTTQIRTEKNRLGKLPVQSSGTGRYDPGLLVRMAEADSQTHHSTLQANRRQIRSAKTNRHQRLSNDYELVEHIEKTNHMDNKSKFADPIFTSIATVIRVITLMLTD